LLPGQLTRRLVLMLTESLRLSLSDRPTELRPALLIQSPLVLLVLKPGPLPGLLPASLPFRLPVAMLPRLLLRIPPRG
jgi:hypothetical protein